MCAFDHYLCCFILSCLILCYCSRQHTRTHICTHDVFNIFQLSKLMLMTSVQSLWQINEDVRNLLLAKIRLSRICLFLALWAVFISWTLSSICFISDSFDSTLLTFSLVLFSSISSCSFVSSKMLRCFVSSWCSSLHCVN